MTDTPDRAAPPGAAQKRTGLGRILAACVIFALSVVTLVLLRPLMALDETRYLSVAWEMRVSGDWLLPHMNGALYTHKPPLLFWLINVVWSLIGVSEFAARLIGPAAALGCVAVTGVLARCLWPAEGVRAGRAALILAGSAVFLLYGSTTMFDALLTLMTLGGIGAVLALRRAPAARWPVVALGVALALGVLTKGPVILLHVLPVALTMPLWAVGTRPRAAQWYGGIGIALLIAVAGVALWLVPASILGGATFREDVLWRQSAGRVVSSFAHGRPIWFYLALLPLLAWPWGWTWAGLHSLAPRRLITDEGARLAVIWFVAAFVAFSLISGKQLHYLLPELPALALILSAARPGPVRGMLWLLVPLAGLVVWGIAVVAGAVPDLPLPGGWFSVLCILAAAVTVAAGVAALRRLADPAIALTALGPALVIALHFFAAPGLWRGYDPVPLGRLLAAHEAQGIAITDAEYPALFNFAGRLQGPVTILPDGAGTAAWAAAHPGGIVLTRDADRVQEMTAVGGRDYYGRRYTVMQAPAR